MIDFVQFAFRVKMGLDGTCSQKKGIKKKYVGRKIYPNNNDQRTFCLSSGEWNVFVSRENWYCHCKSFSSWYKIKKKPLKPIIKSLFFFFLLLVFLFAPVYVFVTNIILFPTNCTVPTLFNRLCKNYV